MQPELWIWLAGLHSLGFALFHMGFWRIFRWRETLPNMSIPDRAILQIANLRLIYLFLCMTLLCWRFPQELLYTPLGRALLLLFGGFWLGRLIEQFIYLPYNHPMVHALSFLFLLGVIVFGLPWIVTLR